MAVPKLRVIRINLFTSGSTDRSREKDSSRLDVLRRGHDVQRLRRRRSGGPGTGASSTPRCRHHGAGRPAVGPCDTSTASGSAAPNCYCFRSTKIDEPTTGSTPNDRIPSSINGATITRNEFSISLVDR